jgi:hypothetical protein
MGRIERKPAIRGVCPGGCAIIATLEDGRLIKTEPDKENPYGAICVRGLAAKLACGPMYATRSHLEVLKQILAAVVLFRLNHGEIPIQMK